MAQPSQPAIPIPDTLKNLEDARKLVLTKAELYPQIVIGVLPLIGAGAHLHLQRWGAEFLAEVFSHPSVSDEDKEAMAVASLPTLATLFEDPAEDSAIVKATMQALTSIYPYIFKHIISNPTASTLWSVMAAIKSKIFRQWDKFTLGIQTCCIKFVQSVILAQTPGAIPDPRRPDFKEISLAMVPRNHPILQISNLEAEASGLLDRMLDVFHRNEREAMLVDATIYCINMIVRKRPNTYNKIMNAVLSFNPLKHAAPGMPMQLRVQSRSMEKTIRAFLMNSNKRNPHHPLAARIQQYIDRLMQAHAEIYDESRKRAAPTELVPDEEQRKRAKLGLHFPPLPPGPTSLAQLFKLTKDEALTSFHVEQLPLDMVIKITLPILHKIDQTFLNEAINAIRSRYLTLEKTRQPIDSAGVSGVDDEDDDYEPDFQPSEDNEQILNKLDSSTDRQPINSGVTLAPFVVPFPPPITTEEASFLAQAKIQSLLAAASESDVSSASLMRKPKAGLHRLAGGNQRSDFWKTMILRLISRPNTIEGEPQIKSEDGDPPRRGMDLSDFIRNSLFSFVMDDFRSRMIVAFDWLAEEWYNDRMRAKSKDEPLPNYEFWVLKVLNGIFQYVDGRDKALLIRFLSEIPQVSRTLLDRFKDLAKDPERVVPVVNALFYLVLYRPPNKDMALDALEDLWKNFEGAGAAAGKMLRRYRPYLFEEAIPKVTNAASEMAVA